MSTDELKCWNCGADLTGAPRPISRHEQCPDCFEALHCCRLCLHFRASEFSSCAEERADPPVIKENANFCDWFQPTSDAFSGERANRKDSAKGKLDALFSAGESDGESDTVPATEEDAPSKERAPSKEGGAKAQLDDLFRKQ